MQQSKIYSLTNNRFKLKHHDHDGLDEVLDAHGKRIHMTKFTTSPLSFPTDVPKETIESIRDATIITTIDVEDNFISISTSDADNPEQENTVSFIPGDTLEISNPLNGETMEVLFTGFVSNI